MEKLIQKPPHLYHGSPRKLDGQLNPILRQDLPDHIHTRAAVFGTAREDIAALFMFPFDVQLASIGFEQDIAYICIWGSTDEFEPKNKGGYVYILPSKSFEKVGKEYEWQSFIAVTPSETKQFDSVIQGMMGNGVQVYFINNNDVFDKIISNKDHRAIILRDLTSENQKKNLNAKTF